MSILKEKEQSVSSWPVYAKKIIFKFEDWSIFSEIKQKSNLIIATLT